MISIVCLFQDDIEYLLQTIPSWLPFCDELVLVSADSSPETIKRLNDVYNLVWCYPNDSGYACSRSSFANGYPHKFVAALHNSVEIDKFDKAYNKAMYLGQEPWVMRLDADEKLDGEPERFKSMISTLNEYYKNKPALSCLLPLYEKENGQLVCINGRARLFRWRDGWKFKYPIDPQPQPPDGVEDGIVVHPLDARVLHLRPSTREASLERNERFVQERLCVGKIPIEEIEHYDIVLETCNEGRR